MEELKILVDMVAHLPQMALWVIAAYFIYKLSVIGSVYATIRFVVAKTHDWLVAKKGATHIVQVGDIKAECIKECYPFLLAQLARLKKATGIYIHRSDVEWLKDAIDMKEAADQQQKGKA